MANGVFDSRMQQAPKLTIKIDGVYLPLEKFKKALDNFYTTLFEIDKETDPKYRPTLEWSIASVNQGSICITAEALPISEEIDPERGYEVISFFRDGIIEIEKRPEIPYGFSPKALRNIKELTDLINPDDFAQIVLSSEDWSIALTKNISNHVDDLTNNFYRYYDSIEGKLESISLSKGMTLGIRDEVTNSVIKCHFPDDLFDQAREALGKRVLVSGLITQIFHGKKKNIDAQEIKVLPPPSEASSVLNLLDFIKSRHG